MNKKFTFMVAALLAAGGFSANADNIETEFAAATHDFNSANYYLIGNTNGYLKAKTVKGTDGKDYTVFDKTGITSTDLQSADSEDLAKALWKIEPVPFQNEIKGYRLINKSTGAALTLKGTGDFDQDQAYDMTGAISEFTWFADDDDSNGKLDDAEIKASVLKTAASGDNHIELSSSAATSIVDNTDQNAEDKLNLYVLNPTEQATVAVNLNDVMSGDGFSFAPADGTEVADDNNIFSKKVKAFYVASAIGDGDKNEVPVGMYFATSYPESLEDANEIDKLADFKKCTFIAVSPKLISGTDYSSKGLKMVEVYGNDLARYKQTEDDQTKGEEVWVYNAAFTVSNYASAPEKYTLSLNKIRYQSKSDGTQTEATNVQIGLNSNKVVTTTDTAKEFKCVNSSVVEGLDLVFDSEKPSIYNIQFVSGEGTDSEKGKYLGVGYTDAMGFVAQGEALVDLESPQYRFLITEVEDNTVTFTNLESKETFEAELYKTAEGDYRLKVNDDKKFKVAQNNGTYSSAADLENTEVKLIPVEANTEAGFLVKAVNNNEPYKFAFATKENAAEKWYLAEAASLATELSDKASDALQFVFEPVEGEDGVLEITSDYIYKKDDNKRYGDEATMTTIQKYVLRVVEAGKARYAKVASATIKLTNAESEDIDEATEFIAKVNYDGSVSLIEATAFDNNKLEATDKRFGVNNAAAPTTIDNTTSGVSIYAVPSATSLKMYMISEELGLSLEAESKHISLEAENGGFIKVAENGDGIVDNLATSTTEDLTFWLDTTNSKSVLPAFYISKAGKFMYNAADSANVWDEINLKATNPYRLGDSDKAIFKAATLVSSDTLKTTVDNKEVTVAAAVNQNKGIVGGIANFQFNIVKADDAEDNYILRSVGGANYVTSNNNVLVFTDDKAAAMRVVVSTAQAPTSNESVSASEVKVIANNGSVVVKNAAGKNVVVSTILGQVVANEVLTSDNATINVPAGIVVVAVEGESFKVNVK